MMTAMLILLSACAHGSARDANRTWCETNFPIFHSEEVWDAMDRKEKEREVAHNEFGVAKCGKEWGQEE